MLLLFLDVVVILSLFVKITISLNSSCFLNQNMIVFLLHATQSSNVTLLKNKF